jgi:hypothetical protein
MQMPAAGHTPNLGPHPILDAAQKSRFKRSQWRHWAKSAVGTGQLQWALGKVFTRMNPARLLKPAEGNDQRLWSEQTKPHPGQNTAGRAFIRHQA